MLVFLNWGTRVWWIADLAFSPDGTLLAAPAGDRGVNIWRTGGSAEPMEIPLPIGTGIHLSFSSDGEYLYVGENELCALRLADHHATRLPFSGLTRLYFAGTSNGQLVVGESPQRSEKRITCLPPGGTGAPLWVETGVGTVYSRPFVLPGGDRIVLVEWVADAGWSSLHRDPERVGAEFVPGGVRLVIRSADTGIALSQSSPLPAYPSNGALSPSGEYLACLTRNFIHVHPLLGPVVDTPAVRNDSGRWFTGLAFHPSGRYLAVTSNDETVKLYDAATWQLARTFTWRVGRLQSVAFSPDGTLAAVGSDTGKVVVWDVDV